MGEKTVQTGNSYVVETDNFVAHALRGKRGFFRDRDVTGAAGRDDDLADAVCLGKSTVESDASIFVIGDIVRGFNYLRCVLGQTGDQDPFLSVFDHGLHDADDLFRCFSRAIDHLRNTLTDGSVVVDLGISEVIKRRGLQLQKCFFRSDVTAL